VPINPATKPISKIGPTTELKSLRTYESDVADLLTKRNTSALTIALAESRKKQNVESIASTPEESSDTGKKLLIVLLSLIFIGAGLFGAYYLYMKSPLAPAPNINPVTDTAKSLIPVDSITTLEISSISQVDLKNKLLAEISRSQEPNTLREIAIVMKDKTNCVEGACDNLVATKIPVATMISSLNIPAPDILIRSLINPWMLGIYSNSVGEKSIFGIVVNNFFQNTFSGMLQWENLMPDDLKTFIINNPKDIIRGQFIDKIVKNKDIREFKSVEGNPVFLYSFIDNSMLIFAVDENIIGEVMSRLEKQSFIR
jgi:hypothetical protein